MRASVVRTGEPGRPLRTVDLPEPHAGPGEVLIRVRGAAIDRVDTFIRRGTHGMDAGGDVVPGRDLAGTVVRVGEGVSGIAVGDAVVATGRAAHAELAVAPAELTFALPAGWSHHEAAALPTAGRTAYDAVAKAGVRAGSTVLVTAAGGGVGSAALQLARARGARVVATVGSRWKAERARALGAESVVLHRGAEWSAELAAAVGTVDAVVETVGAPLWPGALELLADDGTIVCCGVSAGHRLDAHLGRLMVRGWRLVGIGRPDRPTVRRHIAATFAAFDEAGLRPVVDRVLPLALAEEGHRLLEESAFFGRIVVDPTATEESR